MNPAGYLINTKHGQEGEPGLFFNYILARDGLYVQASGPLLRAAIRITEAEVRGLAPFEEYFELVKGKIPRYIYDLAISTLCADSLNERYLAIVWDGQYQLRLPVQDRGSAHVDYDRLPNTIVDIHSHPNMDARFSGIDDSDEKGLQLYMVVGHVETLLPEEVMRVGIYGYFAPVEVNGVFDV